MAQGTWTGIKAKRIKKRSTKIIFRTSNFHKSFWCPTDQGTWTGIKAKKIAERNTRDIFCTSNFIIMLCPKDQETWTGMKAKSIAERNTEGIFCTFYFHSHADTPRTRGHGQEKSKENRRGKHKGHLIYFPFQNHADGSGDMNGYKGKENRWEKHKGHLLYFQCHSHADAQWTRGHGQV